MFAPLMASTVLSTSTSQAATFALSDGESRFTNFSQNPSRVDTSIRFNTLAISNEEFVSALVNADADFIVSPAEASSVSLNKALGEGRRTYLGLAESETRVLGEFVVDAGTLFSFDFTSDFNLQTSIDNPVLSEKARANGDISFALLDASNQSILDFFSIAGNLTTPGNDEDFIALQKSENVTIKDVINSSDVGGNQEFAFVSARGFLQRSFTNRTNLTLVEIKKNKAEVKIPEPSISFAVFISFAALGASLKFSKHS